MTADDSAPHAGSKLGRYVLVREVATGVLGPLYMAERDVVEGIKYGLARVLELPNDLPAKDEQLLADATWDSTGLSHGLVLRVADVITGADWLALIHEHSEGSLIEFLQNMAAQMHGSFAAKVASRVALDVIEGLEQSRDHCVSADKPWRAGSVARGSLLLGPDGRVRALDGQITAAALRVPAMRERPGVAAFAAPEVLDDNKEPTERSDVFSVGVLLWELLTGKKLFDGVTSSDLGRGFKVPKIAQSVPEGAEVPKGLIHAVNTALEAEPMKRQGSLRELAVAIVMGVEEVATHEQVASFADSLLARAGGDDDQPTVLATAPSVASLNGEEPAAMVQPAPAVSADPENATNAALEAEPPSSEVGAEVPLLDHAPSTTEANGEVPLLDHAPSTTEANGEVPLLDHAPSTTEANGEVPLLDHAPSTTDANVDEKPLHHGPSPEDLLLSPRNRERLETLPGHGALPIEAESHSFVSAPSRPNPTHSTSPPPSEPFRLVTDEPFIPVPIQPVPVISAKADADTESVPVSGNGRSSLVRPVASVSSIEAPEAPRRRILQLSVGTVVFGFSTTVLAVVVIMLVLQRSQATVVKEVHIAPAAVVSVATALPAPPGASAQSAVIDSSPANTVAQPDAGSSASATPKGDSHKKSSKEPKSAKSSAPEEAPADSKGPVPSKHYVPSEL